MLSVQKQRDAGARASAASASVTKRKREAEQHAEQRQQDAAKHTDEEAFRTLLFETVKDPSNATWGAVQVCDLALVVIETNRDIHIQRCNCCLAFLQATSGLSPLVITFLAGSACSSSSQLQWAR